MGEAANKINREDSALRVIQLRAQIASKRQQISEELDELRRRKEMTVRDSKRWATAAGLAGVGLIMAGSLANAVCDLFRKEERVESTAHRKDARSQRSPIVSLAMMAIQCLAAEIVRRKVGEYKERRTADSFTSSNTRDNGYYSGEFPSNATI